MSVPAQSLTTNGAVVAIVLACIAIGAAGCSGDNGQSATPSTARPEVPRDAAPAVSRADLAPRPSTKPSVLKRRDLPSVGVERQVSFPAGGDPSCFGTERPQIEFGRRSFPPPAAGNEAGSGYVASGARDDPEIGESFEICVDGLDPTAPVELAVTDPTGGTQRQTLSPIPKGVPPFVMAWHPQIRDPLGQYTVVAKQGERRLTRTFRVHPPSARNIAVKHYPTGSLPALGDDIEVLLLGFRPRELVRVNVYAPSAAGAGSSPFLTAIPARVDRDGMGVIVLPTADDDDPGCYVVRVDIPAGPLDDTVCLESP